MPKFLVSNHTDKPAKLVIEPWAALEILAPNQKAVFEYVEPADIEFVIRPDGAATVGIVSDEIKISTNGRELIFRPPPGNY